MSRINKKNSIGGRYIILIILVVLVAIHQTMIQILNHLQQEIKLAKAKRRVIVN